MVRHSHHHVPAHIGGVHYRPPCCGCGGIDRRQLRKDNAKKKARRRSALEDMQRLQQMQKKQAIPKHVRDMVGIKLKQQVTVDTVAFTKFIQQKGISKEKALEKILDKLVSMYTSEKELMKALKNMDANKLLELLKKLLSTVNESSLEKEDSQKKKVEESKDRMKISKKEKGLDDEDPENDENSDDPESEKNKEKTLKKTVKRRKRKKQTQNDTDKSFEYKENANDLFEKADSSKILDTEETEMEENTEVEVSEEKEITEEKTTEESLDDSKLARELSARAFRIEIEEEEAKFSGSSYSINAINLLKEQEDLELNAIRREVLYKDKQKTADNPIDKEKNDELPAEKLKNKDIDKKKMKELELENEKLKKIILELQQERRNKLIDSLKS